MDGEDVTIVYEAAKKAVERARRGEGPSLIEVKVIRLRGHFEGDPQLYRSKKDMEIARQKDPIPKFKKLLLDKNILTEAMIGKTERDIVKEIHEIGRASCRERV